MVWFFSSLRPKLNVDRFGIWPASVLRLTSIMSRREHLGAIWQGRQIGWCIRTISKLHLYTF